MEQIKVSIKVIAAIAFMLASQAYAETGVTDSQVTVGMSTALSGHASFLGTSFKAGVESYFNIVNEKGGVKGRKIKLIVYDDGYDPGKAVPNVEKLIRDDKVFCLFGNVGTPTSLAIMPIVKAQGVPLIAPFTGAEALRNPVIKYVLNYRASYNQEAEEFIRGMVDVLNYKRIGVFYQNDSYGKAVLKGVRTALQKRGLEPIIAGNYMRNTENITAALDAIIKEKPEAVVMVGTYAACAKFIIEGRKKGFNPVYINVSFVGPDKLAELLGKYGDKVVVTQVVPPLLSDSKKSYPVVLEYLNANGKYFPESRPNSVGMEGFLAAKVFVEGLKRADKSLTRDSLISAFEGINNLDIGAGNRVSFSSLNHQGSQKVYPTVIQNGKFQLVENWSEVK
jgi:branched-chain amino acid transport system substrate-binding protein